MAPPVNERPTTLADYGWPPQQYHPPSISLEAYRDEETGEITIFDPAGSERYVRSHNARPKADCQ